MQTAQVKAEAERRKAKLARSYQELLDEFANTELTSVGNYTLGRFIGKGSFGKVYLASHKLTNGSKVVLKSARKDDENLAREIHHHRQFVHPHIARLYEVVVTENMVWLVLEYCPGDELYNYLLKHGKLSVEKVQRTFTQLVGAVSYVHQQNCVHRDLKLENILLDKHESVKLVDFGFTREYEGKANYLTTFCGTICYSAPEMLKGEKYAGEKVDVWSLGVILYALLCGELPFDDDDDAVTRKKILTEEPNYPDHVPADAQALLKKLLSKRPLLRPSLPDILNHPFLAEHAPQQQEILRIQHAPAFSTPLEKETLQRMRSAGVNIDNVIESVISRRCDALAGWWTLLLEKEERKARRREQKRKEKELERRNSRRFSQASSRLERLAPVGEEGGTPKDGEHPPLPNTRGRAERRSGTFPHLTITDFPTLLSDPAKLNGGMSPDTDIPPPPIDKDSIRSASSSRHRRPIPPPKEGVLRSARSRGSTLHLVTTNEVLTVDNSSSPHTNGAGSKEKEATWKKVKRKPSQAIVAHWKNWTHWIVENTKRKSKPGRRGSQSTPNLHAKGGAGGSPKDGRMSKSSGGASRPQTSKYPTADSRVSPSSTGLPKSVVANGYAHKGGDASATAPVNGGQLHSPASTTLSTPSQIPPGLSAQMKMQSSSYKRQSLSPSPLTPRSTMRRASGTAGLRGRKSTSSSVSSIRSIHHAHHHSHSKASSTSSNGSISTSVSKTPTALHARSPHTSVKVLPATPTTTSFPSNIRLVRGGGVNGPPLSIFNEGMPSHSQQQQALGLNASSNYLQTGSNTNNLPPLATSSSPFGNFGNSEGAVAGGMSPVVGGGVMFAKRKRNLFKGPMLSLGRSGDARSTGSGGSHSRSASASGLGGRRSGEITIQEEEEEEDEYDEDVPPLPHFGLAAGGDEDKPAVDDGVEEVEEVEAFSPLIRGPGETIEEQIFEEGDDEETALEEKSRKEGMKTAVPAKVEAS
jgi:serine/threonine protein kinase